jgi:tRNA/rRNA methyltransferase
VSDPALARISVVLVEPQSAGNVGAAARALRNMGLSRLVLVRAPDTDVSEARRLAMGGRAILRRARRVGSLREAIDDARLVIGTSRRGGKNRGPALDVRAAMVRAVEAARQGNAVALVFGREDAGLTNAELDACHLLARIPASPADPSLNLAAAVAVVAYELWRAAGGGMAPEPRVLATARQTEALFEDLGSVLIEIGFLNPKHPEAMMHALRRLLGRASVDPREVRILRGILRQVRWAIEHKPRG